ncbi:MAG TPA: FCD domain-containing protein [Acidimicrobiales bacterium]|nr:FCD domain-containing protein [Acidimicrobiales bacterium]
MLEARETLECRLAALAATRREEADLARIDAAVVFMASEVEADELGVEGDAAFHGAVTAAAHNGVLAHLMAALADQIAETRTESLREPGRPPRSLAAHRRIAAAIRAGDPRAAAAAMRRHLEEVADVGLLR